MLNDYRVFFREYVRNFHTTGAIAPSSRRLGAALARYVAAGAQPRRVLEVGPGTGAVTQCIIRSLGPDDRLDIVELNDRFVQHLRRRFQVEPLFAQVADRTTILHHSVVDLAREGQYDTIVSGLPLNNFTVSDVQRIMQAFAGLLAPQGTLSFFEYIGIRPARALVSGRGERQRLRGIGEALEAALKASEFRREWIWPNVPPAWVHHVRLRVA